MTEQQYNRACQIKDRLEELTDVKKQIEGTSTHRLYFAHKESGGDFRCCPDWSMRYISEILDKHDRMIRQEIEEEIERLKKEIDEI